MKRWKMAIIILMVFPLTGCIQKYNVPDNKSEAVAEYMAGLLLESDMGYKQELTSEEELNINTSDEEDTGQDTEVTPTDEPATDVINSDGTNTDSNTTTQEAPLTDVIGAKNFDLSYKGYKLTDTYPEDAESLGFSLNPRSGYKLLVVSFKIKNTAKTEKKFNLIKEDIVYQLVDDNGNSYEPLFTLLENDMQYVDLTIASGKSQDGVLIFEIPKNDNLTKANLSVLNGEKTVTIELK